MILKRATKVTGLTCSLLTVACVSNPAPVTAVSQVTAAAMAPHFECALYFSQIQNSARLDISLDKGATIGEADGLSVAQIMNSYQLTKQQQRENVLSLSIEFASQRKNLIPRISGGPPQPNSEEELRAWKALYQEQCEAS